MASVDAGACGYLGKGMTFRIGGSSFGRASVRRCNKAFMGSLICGWMASGIMLRNIQYQPKQIHRADLLIQRSQDEFSLLHSRVRNNELSN